MHCGGRSSLFKRASSGMIGAIDCGPLLSEVGSDAAHTLAA